MQHEGPWRRDGLVLRLGVGWVVALADRGVLGWCWWFVGMAESGDRYGLGGVMVGLDGG